MFKRLTNVSNLYHRAAVNRVDECIISPSGQYEMVKITFILFTPDYACSRLTMRARKFNGFIALELHPMKHQPRL